MSRYFDKFIDDQIKRANAIKKARADRQVKPEDDTKRNMVNHYRERIKNLLRASGKKNG